MNQFVIAQISDRCDRGCTHCCIGAKPDGELMSINNVKFLVKSIPHGIGTYVCLTGGEPLLHPNLERIMDILADNDVATVLLTRGHTSEEQSRNLLPYRNFRSALKRTRTTDLKVHLSFDAYGFGGDRERSLDAFVSTARRLRNNGELEMIKTTSSPERQDDNANLLLEGLERAGFFRGRESRGYVKQLIEDELTSLFKKQDGMARECEVSEMYEVRIHFSRLARVARAENLDETFRQKRKCDVFQNCPSIYVAPNLDVRPCCDYHAKFIPEITNLRGNLPDPSGYLKALRKMGAEFRSSGVKGDICDYCVKNMPRLLGRK